MKWHHTGIEVASLEDSISFYKEAFGFEIKSCLKLDEEKIVFMSRGPVTIELIECADQNGSPSSIHFAWEVGDLASWREQLSRYGLKPIDGPYSLDSGLTVIFYKGPDGEVIELVAGA